MDIRKWWGLKLVTSNPLNWNYLYSTPRPIKCRVRDQYGVIEELWLAGESRRTVRKMRCSATSSIMNLTWSHPRLNPGIRCEKPTSRRRRNGEYLWKENRYVPAYTNIMNSIVHCMWETQRFWSWFSTVLGDCHYTGRFVKRVSLFVSLTESIMFTNFQKIIGQLICTLNSADTVIFTKADDTGVNKNDHRNCHNYLLYRHVFLSLILWSLLPNAAVKMHVSVCPSQV
jgi:hypothetical protein